MQFSNKVYNVLRDVAQVYLPAVGALYFALAAIWGLPAAEQVSGTVLAVDTALGAVLKLSTSSYNKSDEKFGGTLRVEDGEDGSTLRIKGVDPVVLTTQDEITFKIVKE